MQNNMAAANAPSGVSAETAEQAAGKIVMDVDLTADDEEDSCKHQKT